MVSLANLRQHMHILFLFFCFQLELLSAQLGWFALNEEEQKKFGS